jgi:hypothetical protein
MLPLVIIFGGIGLIGLLPTPVWAAVMPVLFLAAILASFAPPRHEKKSWWTALKPLQKAELSPSARRLIGFFGLGG